MIDRPSVVSFFLDGFRGTDESQIPSKDQISEALRPRHPIWQTESSSLCPPVA